MFIYIGTERFADFEENREPWLIANSDFHGMSNIDIIIFADYWVCTVITAVGYGDYTAGTSLEYCYAMMLEFLGFVIFAILQIAILQIMNLERGHQEALNDNDVRIMIWL